MEKIKEFNFWNGHSLNFLETLPRANYHCAELAAGALYKALNTIKP